MSEEHTDDQETVKIIPVDIEHEIKQSYLNYAMSVIVSRALPDARDGLKPVHRRILYSMYEIGLRHNSPTKKAARVLGDVLAKYHPHGQDSVYNALVRLAQDFSLRYPLVEGQGNFGSIDGDPPAAYRYTETRLAAISEEMLADIKKKTVDFRPNYDESQEEPTVLPAALPSLLLNGSTGIAVGFTTEIPPHNLREIADAVVALADNPDLPVEELIKIVKGPDFPVGGIIKGTRGIYSAFKNGNGRITIQSRHVIEQAKDDSERIVFIDIPYMKRKSDLILQLAEQVNNENISDIKDIRDESNREGIRVVVELKKNTNTSIVLQRIFSLTEFQSNYSINFVALVKGRPHTLNLKDMLQIYIDHRKEVILRKTKFELDEAEARAHILRGLLVALHNIDEVIVLIRESETPAEAKEKLIANFGLDEIQAQAILDMRLHRLTSLEVNKIERELLSLEELIKELNQILQDPQKVIDIIKETILEIAKKYGDERRTEIQEGEALSISEEELIDEEDVVVTLTDSGYIKRTPLEKFGVQRRGGKGKFGLSLTKGDELKHVYVGSTHDTVLFITSKGRAFILKLYQIPMGSRTSRGQSINHLLTLADEEYISSLLYAPAFDTEESEKEAIVLAAKSGKTKKVAWQNLSGAVTKRGIRIMTLAEDDEVIGGVVASDMQDIFMFSQSGKVLRFSSESLRSMGRTASGVGGMKLKKEDDCITSIYTGNDESIFIVLSEKGFGKRLRASDIHPHGRNTSGVVCMGINQKTGKLVVATPVEEHSFVTAMTKKGKTLRVPAKTCAVQGRAARGVSVITIDEDDVLTSAVVTTEDDE